MRCEFVTRHVFSCQHCFLLYLMSLHLSVSISSFFHQDFEKISEFFKANYKVELMEKDMSVKGWNWGTAKFSGNTHEQNNKYVLASTITAQF